MAATHADRDDDRVDFRRLRDLLEILSELYLDIYLAHVLSIRNNKIITFNLLFIRRDHDSFKNFAKSFRFIFFQNDPRTQRIFGLKKLNRIFDYNLSRFYHPQSLIILPIFVIVWDRFDRGSSKIPDIETKDDVTAGCNENNRRNERSFGSLFRSTFPIDKFIHVNHNKKYCLARFEDYCRLRRLIAIRFVLILPLLGEIVSFRKERKKHEDLFNDLYKWKIEEYFYIGIC